LCEGEGVNRFLGKFNDGGYNHAEYRMGLESGMADSIMQGIETPISVYVPLSEVISVDEF
jgi:hypothetical protein